MLTYELAMEIAKHTRRVRGFKPGQSDIIQGNVEAMIDYSDVPYELSRKCRLELCNSEEFCDKAGIIFEFALYYLDLITSGMHLAFFEKYHR